MSSVIEHQRQCLSGRYGRGTGLCGCSSASNCGWVRGVWVRGDGTGASRPGAVTPRLARTSAETPGGSARVGLLGLQCNAGGCAAPRPLRPALSVLPTYYDCHRARISASLGTMALLALLDLLSLVRAQRGPFQAQRPTSCICLRVSCRAAIRGQQTRDISASVWGFFFFCGGGVLPARRRGAPPSKPRPWRSPVRAIGQEQSASLHANSPVVPPWSFLPFLPFLGWAQRRSLQAQRSIR
jgi:hypothetical protein